MKQVKTILLIALALLLLVGCGNKKAEVSDGKEVLVKVGDVTVTKQDLYETLTAYDEGSIVASMIDEKIVDAEITDLTEVEATVDEEMENYRNEGSLETLINYYGYEDEESFREYLIKNEKAGKLYEKYIDEHWDDLVDEHYPVKLKMIQIEFDDDTKDEASEKIEKAIEEIKAGANFEEVAEKYSDDTSLASETFYVQTTISDANVRAFVLGKSANLSSKITSSDGDCYYVVQVTQSNALQLKEEFSAYLNGTSDFSDEVIKFYAAKHNVQFYDTVYYKYINSSYPEYLNDED